MGLLSCLFVLSVGYLPCTHTYRVLFMKHGILMLVEVTRNFSTMPFRSDVENLSPFKCYFQKNRFPIS